MTRFRALGIDDEPAAHEVLRALLRDHPDIDLAACCASAEAARDALSGSTFDLVFLDVAMPSASGFALLRSLARRPLTVMITAHAQHALEAFDLGVRDYLLKPVSAQRMALCLERVRPLLAAARLSPHEGVPQRLAVKCGSTQRLVDPRRVRRVEAAGNFCEIHGDGERVFASEAMKDLEQRLAMFGFVRVHKSHLVNPRCVRSTGANGLVLDDGSAVPFGRSYRAAALESLSLYAAGA